MYSTLPAQWMTDDNKFQQTGSFSKQKVTNWQLHIVDFLYTTLKLVKKMKWTWKKNWCWQKGYIWYLRCLGFKIDWQRAKTGNLKVFKKNKKLQFHKWRIYWCHSFPSSFGSLCTQTYQEKSTHADPLISTLTIKGYSDKNRLFVITK